MPRKLSKVSVLAGALGPLVVALGLSAVCCSSEAPKSEAGKVVYAVRQHTLVNGGEVSIEVAGGMGQVMDYGRYVPGGRIEVVDLDSGAIENVLEDFQSADISGLDLSFDATRIVFSMKKSGDDSYHVYIANLARGADGRYEIHQLTFGPQDDDQPVLLAGGKIAFVTNQGYTEMGTRADEYNHSRVVTQIATITLDGGDADRKLCSQNLSHTLNPTALSDGRVLFSRWEHLENVNDVKLFAMNPDCSQMTAVSGQHGKPSNSLVQVVETTTPGVFVAVATNRENTIQSGALVQVDARSQKHPERVDEEAPAYTMLTPAVPRGDEPSPVGRYRSPNVLPDGRILTSWSAGFVNDLDELSLTPPDFGVYVYDPASRANQLVVNHPDTWELYAHSVGARTEPPVIDSIQNSQDSTVSAIFGSIDIKNTSLFTAHHNTVSGAQFDGTPVDEALKQAKKVRIIEGFSSEAAGVTMFGLTMAEGGAILGEADVQADGSWLAEIPPFVPVHMQPVDEFDLSIRSQTTWVQGMPGEDRVCGGCHESRTAANLPGGQALTIAAGKGAQKFNTAIAQRVEYPWDGATDATNPNEIQQLLDGKCVSCHNETTNGSGPQEFYTVTMTNDIAGTTADYQIPRLDLTSRPITVTYDNMTEAWPASYVSLFYPSALAMEMGKNGTTVVGTVPPEWAVPSDARNSALIEKLNMTSSASSDKTAWKLGQAFSDPEIRGGKRTLHPDDVGIVLTRDERRMLIRTIDFQPYDSDPVAGNGYGK